MQQQSGWIVDFPDDTLANGNWIFCSTGDSFLQLSHRTISEGHSLMKEPYLILETANN